MNIPEFPQIHPIQTARKCEELKSVWEFWLKAGRKFGFSARKNDVIMED
jgi:hypothetical protein